MAAGFVHGVLNTDNIAITGESFDYGPWRFLPRFDAGFTAAYFDHNGLYAYGRQPQALLWNLARLAECLLEFAPHAGLTDVLSGFPALYERELDRSVFGESQVSLFLQAHEDGAKAVFFSADGIKTREVMMVLG